MGVLGRQGRWGVSSHSLSLSRLRRLHLWRQTNDRVCRSRSRSRSKRSEEESEVEDNRKELRCVVWGRLLERLATTSPALYTRKSLYRVWET